MAKNPIKKLTGRPYPPDVPPQLDNENLSQHRPVHMIASAAVIAGYSVVEANVSLLVTKLASADPAPIAAIYGQLRQGRFQAAALKAVASVTLSADDGGLLKKLMDVVQVASDARDIIAHHLWMRDDQFPEDIVFAEAGLPWQTEHQVRLGGGPGPQDIQHAMGIHDLMRKQCQIWSLADLEHARLKSVHAAVGLVTFGLMHRSSAGSEARMVERQKVMDAITLGSD